MKTFFFDIETIPNPNIPAPTFDPDEVKLGNTKDPVKIKAKLDEAELAFKDGLVKKMSLDPDLCQVVSFAWNHGDDETESLTDSMLSLKVTDMYIVASACNIITQAHLEGHVLVSFNGIGFDLPVLQRRAMLLNCKGIPGSIYQLLTKRYRPDVHFDVMQELGAWQRDKLKKQDYYLRLFNVGTVSDMNGSMVYDAWKNEEYDRIAQYCASDVDNLKALFGRIVNYLY